MISRLFKDQLFSVLKVMGPAYLLVLALTLLAYGTLRASGTLFQTVSMFFLFTSIICIFGMLFFTLIFLGVRFYKTMYGSLAGLEHTIPVSTQKLFAVKALVGVIFVACSVLLLFFCLFLLGGDTSGIIIQNLNADLSFGIASVPAVILAAVLQYSAILMAIYSGIVAGHKLDQHKGVFSAVFGIVFYIAMMALMAGIVFLAAMSCGGLDMLWDQQKTLEYIRVLIPSLIAGYLAAGSALFASCLLMLRNGLDIN